jgi:hypothetical protein
LFTVLEQLQPLVQNKTVMTKLQLQGLDSAEYPKIREWQTYVRERHSYLSEVQSDLYKHAAIALKNLLSQMEKAQDGSASNTKAGGKEAGKTPGAQQQQARRSKL